MYQKIKIKTKMDLFFVALLAVLVLNVLLKFVCFILKKQCVDPNCSRKSHTTTYCKRHQCTTPNCYNVKSPDAKYCGGYCQCLWHGCDGLAMKVLYPHDPHREEYNSMCEKHWRDYSTY